MSLEDGPLFFVGIDWAATEHAVCVLDQAGHKVAAFSIEHTAAGFARLTARLNKLGDTQAPPPNTPDQQPPAEPGMIPLTIPETARLLATIWNQPKPDDHHIHWRNWRRRHQARARWFHQRARLSREYSLSS